MKVLFAIFAALFSIQVWATPCPVTVGTLTLNVYQPRTACVSPCLLFFDTTGSPSFFQSDSHHTTDSATLGGSNTVVQDIYYTWDFGDPNTSGTGTWIYGSRPNTNLKNKATGPIAAHLYVLPTSGTTDLNPIVQVWAYDGTNIATCTLSVTVYAPSGANGFPNTSTICAFNSSQGSGCPAGAATVPTGSLSTALGSFGTGKRVLLKCGDTFTGAVSVATTVRKASIGAYGGCENSSSGRPILNNTGGTTITIHGDTTGGATDIRVADLFFSDGAKTSIPVVFGYDGNATWSTQITVYNITGNLVQTLIQSEATQSGLIQSALTGGASQYGTFPNVGGSKCINGSIAPFCGGTSYIQSNYGNASYNAFMGDFVSALGGAGNEENTRIGECRMCVFSNNTLQFLGASNALLKIHEGQTNQPTWIGQYTEIFEISDNFFTNEGPQSYAVAFAPQNTAADEHLRYAIFERNLWYLNDGGSVGLLIAASLNTTVRNNVFYASATSGPTAAYGFFAANQGNALLISSIEMYNNTCYTPNAISRITSACVSVDANSSSFIQNNLFYAQGAAVPVAQNPTGNTLGNNSPNSTTNFNPTNHSAAFNNITDFKPASPMTGATCSVPNYFVAFLLATAGVCTDLGALSPAAGAP